MNDRYHALDGLRGWAALLVMLLHIFYQVLPPAGVLSLSLDTWWPFTGKFSVAVFFLVSGYSLSVKYLKSGEKEALYRMASGRYFRLIIPVFAACLVMHVFMVAGMVPEASERPAHLAGYFAFDTSIGYLLEYGLYGVIFAHEDALSYAPPLWTISFEFFGSMLVASLLLFLGPPAGRRAAYVAVSLLLLVYAPWYFLFVAGVIAAGLHDWFARWISNAVGCAFVAVGLLLSALSNEYAFAIVISATLFFFGALHTKALNDFFSNAFSRYLGQISFPLYLIHIPVAFGIGLPIYLVDQSSLQQTLGAAIAAASASIFAAVVFVPVNNWAIAVSRVAGARMTHFMLGGKPAAATAE